MFVTSATIRYKDLEVFLDFEGHTSAQQARSEIIKLFEEALWFTDHDVKCNVSAELDVKVSPEEMRRILLTSSDGEEVECKCE